MPPPKPLNIWNITSIWNMYGYSGKTKFSSLVHITEYFGIESFISACKWWYGCHKTLLYFNYGPTRAQNNNFADSIENLFMSVRFMNSIACRVQLLLSLQWDLSNYNVLTVSWNYFSFASFAIFAVAHYEVMQHSSIITQKMEIK